MAAELQQRTPVKWHRYHRRRRLWQHI